HFRESLSLRAKACERGLDRGAERGGANLGRHRGYQMTPGEHPPGVCVFPPFLQRFAPILLSVCRSPFRVRSLGVRSGPRWSLSQPGISQQNSRNLWLPAPHELPARSLSHPSNAMSKKKAPIIPSPL